MMNAKTIGRWTGHLLALAVLLAFLAAAEDSCASEQVVVEPVPSPVPTPTADSAGMPPMEPMEPMPPLEPVGEDSLSELKYLTESYRLMEEGGEILDDFLRWVDDVLVEYDLGVLFPDTTDGRAALDRWRDFAWQVESLDVPPIYQESHDLWVEALSEAQLGIELNIAGAEQLDPSLVEQGTAHVVEATRLLSLANDALERVDGR